MLLNPWIWQYSSNILFEYWNNAADENIQLPGQDFMTETVRLERRRVILPREIPSPLAQSCTCGISSSDRPRP